jgi:hypothetical protein
MRAPSRPSCTKRATASAWPSNFAFKNLMATTEPIVRWRAATPQLSLATSPTEGKNSPACSALALWTPSRVEKRWGAEAWPARVLGSLFSSFVKGDPYALQVPDSLWTCGFRCWLLVKCFGWSRQQRRGPRPGVRCSTPGGQLFSRECLRRHVLREWLHLHVPDGRSEQEDVQSAVPLRHGVLSGDGVLYPVERSRRGHPRERVCHRWSLDGARSCLYSRLPALTS